MYYGFKTPPKQAVEKKAYDLFGRDRDVEVIGNRLSSLDAKTHGLPSGVYLVECFVDKKHIARAYSKDWRKAYKLLLIEVEKAFEASLHETNDAVQ